MSLSGVCVGVECGPQPRARSWHARARADKNFAEPTTATARLGHGDETAPLLRSSAEVVTHRVCAQGRGRDVSARGRATAGVGSETAGGGLANTTARPPRCSAASIALARQHRTPSCPAGAGGAAMSPQKSKWRAPRKCRRWASSCCRLHAARSASLLLRFGGTSTYLGCVWEPLCPPLPSQKIALCTIGL